jgi:hypothetical protein
LRLPPLDLPWPAFTIRRHKGTLIERAFKRDSRVFDTVRHYRFNACAIDNDIGMLRGPSRATGSRFEPIERLIKR